MAAWLSIQLTSSISHRAEIQRLPQGATHWITHKYKSSTLPFWVFFTPSTRKKLMFLKDLAAWCPDGVTVPGTRHSLSLWPLPVNTRIPASLPHGSFHGPPGVCPLPVKLVEDPSMHQQCRPTLPCGRVFGDPQSCSLYVSSHIIVTTESIQGKGILYSLCQMLSPGAVDWMLAFGIHTIKV